MPKLTRTLAMCLALLFAFGPAGEATAQDEHDGSWPRFRGPNGQGWVQEVPPAKAAFTDADVRWRTSLPGEGHSSPVSDGERLYVTAADADAQHLTLVRLDPADGAIVWQRDFPFDEADKHRFNSFASASPAVDGDHVYLLIWSAEQSTLVALDHEGEQVWQQPLGRYREGHGSGVSPIVHGERVIVAYDHRGDEAAIFAFDRLTGEPHWRLDREPGRAAYATPIVYRDPDGVDHLIVASDVHGLTGIDIESGDVLWQFEDAFTHRVVGSAALADDVVINASGVGNGGRNLVGVRAGAADGSRPAERLFELDSTLPYVPTPLYAHGLVFLLTDGGVVSCLDPATGEVKWRERIGGNYFASPICINDVIYCVSRDGEVVTLRAGDSYEELGRSELGGPTHATPAYVNGRLLLRTEREVICIE